MQKSGKGIFAFIGSGMKNHTDVSNWYNEKYEKSGDATRRSVKAFYQIMDYLSVNSNLLDIGCGRGEFLEFLVQKGFQNLSGVDISNAAIHHVKNKIPQCDLRIAAGENLPFADESFQQITCLGVLEHFLDIPKGLSELNRVCKTNGTVIIMVPNKNFIGWLLKKSENKGTQQIEISETLYSLPGWKNLIETAGFEIEDISADRGFIYNNADNNSRGIKYYLKRLLNILLPLIPINLTYQFIFKTTKK